MRRDMYNMIGGLDEEFVMYYDMKLELHLKK